MKYFYEKKTLRRNIEITIIMTTYSYFIFYKFVYYDVKFENLQTIPTVVTKAL